MKGMCESNYIMIFRRGELTYAKENAAAIFVCVSNRDSARYPDCNSTFDQVFAEFDAVVFRGYAHACVDCYRRFALEIS